MVIRENPVREVASFKGLKAVVADRDRFQCSMTLCALMIRGSNREREKLGEESAPTIKRYSATSTTDC